MKDFFKHICTAVLIALVTLPATAQLYDVGTNNGDGYYRFRNAKHTNHSIILANDKFTYQSVVGVAGGASNARNEAYWPYMLNCACAFLQNDIHLIESDTDNDVISPAAVIYGDKRNTNTSNIDYDLIAQGASLLSMTAGKYVGTSVGDIPVDGRYIQIQKVDGEGADTRYKATIKLDASYTFLIWTYNIDMGTLNFIDDNGNFALSEDVPDSAMWYIDRINHFNVFPEAFNGKFYTTLKVPFEWRVDTENNSKVEAIYVIEGFNGDGSLKTKRITGTVPAGTPVILECGTDDPAQCRLVPLGKPKAPAASTDNNYSPAADTLSYYTGANLLGGTYFCNTDGNVKYIKTASGVTGQITGNHYTPITGKFELGIKDGKFGFVEAQGVTMTTYNYDAQCNPVAAGTIQAMPANKAWMDQQGGLFPTVAKPTISLDSGTYSGTQSVTITCSDNTATILYSTDGGTTWTEYNGAIELSETTTLMAKANKIGLYNCSETVSAEYVIAVPELAMTPESMTINDAAPGVFTITGANIDGNINASLANYTDWYLNPETFSNTGGEVNVTYTGRALSAQNTVIAQVANNPSVTASATVNYKADIYIVTDNGIENNWDFNNGTMMADEDGIYTATFTATVPNTYIMFARKLGDGVNWGTRYVFGPDSEGDWWMSTDVASQGGSLDMGDDDPIKLQLAGEYTITINANDYTFNITRKIETLAAPEFTPAAGTYTEPQSVTITAQDGATIYYTTDGSEPTTESAVYTEPITVNEGTTTIKAIAVMTGWNNSEVATAQYVIEIPVTVVPGDVNEDGIVNIMDVTDLIDYLLENPDVVINLRNADIDADGTINIKDLTDLIDILVASAQ